MRNRILNWFRRRERVVYDQSFFRDAWFANWEALQHVLGALILSRKDWLSVLDFGCGPGIMIDYMNARGVSYVGCDYSSEARNLYLERFGANPACYGSSLEQLQTSDFDVFLSFDVFEHMSDAQIGLVLAQTVDIKHYFLNISRDWRTPGHINIKSDKSWIRFFAKHGLVFDEAATRAMRLQYMDLRPGQPDGWGRNMFVFGRPE